MSASVSSRELFDVSSTTGMRAGLDPAELGDRDLEVAQQLEQHRLELLVGLVDLVDQQDDGLGDGDRLQQRPGEQELLAEDVVLDGLPAGAVGLGLDPQQLLAVVPLVERLGLVEALVALQAHEVALQVLGQRLGQLGLADAGRALDEHRLAEAGGEVGDQRGRLTGQVADALKALGDLVDGRGDDGALIAMMLGGACTGPRERPRVARSESAAQPRWYVNAVAASGDITTSAKKSARSPQPASRSSSVTCMR